MAPRSSQMTPWSSQMASQSSKMASRSSQMASRSSQMTSRSSQMVSGHLILAQDSSSWLGMQVSHLTVRELDVALLELGMQVSHRTSGAPMSVSK